MKKFLLLILAVLSTSVALAAPDFNVVYSSTQTLYFKITDATNRYVQVTYPSNSTSNPWSSSYIKPTGDLTIPSSVDHDGTTYSVTSIGQYAFYGCSGLTSVTIPNTVTIIGQNAFINCSNINNVYYTGSIDEWCGIQFSNAYSNPTVFHHNLIINSQTVTNVSLTTATTISSYAFYGYSGLTSVTIPSGVTSIGESAFNGCIGITGTLTIPGGVTSIGASAFNGCTGITGSLTIPSGVTSIGSSAFKGCSHLSEVIFNATSCTSMGLENSPVFENCDSLTSITIGQGVTKIPNYAFKKCQNITSITIPTGVTSIGKKAFAECSLLSTVNFNPTQCGSSGNSGYYVFNDCPNLTTINIGDGVTQIPDEAFGNMAALTTINIPSS